MSPEQMNRIVALNNALTTFALAAPLLAALLMWVLARRRGIPGLPLAFGGSVAHVAGLYLTGWLFGALHDEPMASLTTVNRALRAGAISQDAWARGAELANQALAVSLVGGMCLTAAVAFALRRARPLEPATSQAKEPQETEPAQTPTDAAP